MFFEVEIDRATISEVIYKIAIILGINLQIELRLNQMLKRKQHKEKKVQILEVQRIKA